MNTLLTVLLLCPAAEPPEQIKVLPREDMPELVGRWEWTNCGPGARVYYTFHKEGTYRLNIVRDGKDNVSDEAKWKIEGDTLTTWIMQGHLRLESVYSVEVVSADEVVLTDGKQVRRLVRVK